MRYLIFLIGILCFSLPSQGFDAQQHTGAVMMDEATLKAQKLEVATFAAGCFWCVESEFQAIAGVKEVVSGYTGGTVENPSYEQVSTKKTGHFEAVRVVYDPSALSYEKLLEAFWLIHDPTQADGQGVDIGPQYTSAIFYHDAEQKSAAHAAKTRATAQFSKPIATVILPASTFYSAEGCHQDYYAKKGIEYKSVFELGGESTTMRKRKGWFGF